MIQRIQTIYLILAVIAGCLTFFLPFTHFYAGDLQVGEYAMFGVFNIQSDTLEMTNPMGFPMWILATISIASALLSIFFYKERKRQIKVVRLSFFLHLAWLVFAFFAIDAINNSLYAGSIRILYHSGFYMPLIALIFLFLAIRGIKKDEELVRSLDRLR